MGGWARVTGGTRRRARCRWADAAGHAYREQPGQQRSLQRGPRLAAPLPEEAVAVVLQAEGGVVGCRQRQQRPVAAPALCGRHQAGTGQGFRRSCRSYTQRHHGERRRHPKGGQERAGPAPPARRHAPPPPPSCTRRHSARHCRSSSLSEATEALSSTRMMRLIRSSPVLNTACQTYHVKCTHSVDASVRPAPCGLGALPSSSRACEERAPCSHSWPKPYKRARSIPGAPTVFPPLPPLPRLTLQRPLCVRNHCRASPCSAPLSVRSTHSRK